MLELVLSLNFFKVVQFKQSMVLLNATKINHIKLMKLRKNSLSYRNLKN